MGRPRKYPLVTAKERSLIEPNPDQDPFYMPGYSDRRTERELDIREGRPPRPINGRLQAVVTQDLQGKPYKIKERQERARGGKPLTVELAKSLGYDVEHSGYEVRPDGSIGLNEYTLFYRPPEAAETHLKRVEARGQAMAEAAQAKMEDATASLNAQLGLEGRGASAPIFEAETEK